MDNKEKDIILKSAIQQMEKIPESIENKIENALNKINKKQQKQNQNKKILSIAASILVIITLFGNIVAYANGSPNIFSYVLNKFNIGEEYEKEAIKIGETVKSGGIEITITDLAIDENLLVIGYHIITENKLDEEFLLEGLRTIKTKEREMRIDYTSIGEKIAKQQIEKITDKEYYLYEIYQIDYLKLDSDIQLNIKIEKVQTYIENKYEIGIQNETTGHWEFNIALEKNEIENIKKYTLEGKIITLESDQTVEITNVKTTKVGSIIDIYAYIPKIGEISIQVKNEKGEIVLPKNTQKITQGINNIIMKKTQDKKLIVEVYEYGTDKILGKIEIILEETNIKEKSKQYKTITFEDLILTIPEDWENNTKTKENIVFTIYKNYNQNIKQAESSVIITKIKNDGKNTLEEIKENIMLSKETGVDLREENYFLWDSLLKKYVWIDQKDYDNEKSNNKFKLTKSEIQTIIKENKNIQKGDLNIKKEDLKDIIQEGFEVKKEEKIRVKEKDAYKITIQTRGGAETIYLFEKNEGTYQITYNPQSAQKNEIQKMIYTALD